MSKCREFPENLLEKIWEELEKSTSISTRAIALKMMQKIKAASGCPESLEGPLFNFIRQKAKDFVAVSVALEPFLGPFLDGFRWF